MRRKILVIAPTLYEHEPLPGVRDEIEELQRYHDVTPLRDDVDLAGITRAVNKGRFDALWFSTGATDGQLHLSRQRIDHEQIIGLAKACKARLVVLSACDTQMLPNRLRVANVHVFAGITELIDHEAASVMMLFAKALHNQRSIRKAYEAIGAGDNYLYLSPNGSLEDDRWYWLIAGAGISAAMATLYMAIGA
jgi:hypothetical protein